MREMKSIAVFSDTRLPTKADGGHGLGMSAHSIATGLAERGHDVTLCAAHGSEFEAGKLREFNSETEMALWWLRELPTDAVLDTGHYHKLSQLGQTAPVLNRICDRECNYVPPNAVTNSAYMQEIYLPSILVNTGIKDLKHFRHDHDGYLLYAGQQNHDCGYDLALEVARRSGYPLSIASGLSGNDKWELYAGAMALLHPSRKRAAPRLPIELGYCGVPTICLAGDGTEHMIENGRTGFVCNDVNEMVKAVNDLNTVSRRAVLNRVIQHHNYDHMIGEYELILESIYNEFVSTYRLSDVVGVA